MVPLKRKKTLVVRVKVSKWGWSMALGPLKRKKTLIGLVRASKWGWSRAMGQFKTEEDFCW